MPWLRVGDSAATNPIVAEVREHPSADDRTKLEVFGFVTLCATVGAQHLTDYVVSRATAADVAGSLERADQLIELAVFAGYFEPVVEQVKGQPRQRWKIIEDPEFFHMRTEEEVEWERRRKRDNSNPALTIPVRLRDGDGCRYCGQVVKFRARTGRLRGTYDHRRAGRGAETPDDLVVACDRCNSGRKNNPHADKDYPLLPVPAKPYYSEDTVEFIANSEWARSNGITPPPRPRTRVQPGHVPPGHDGPRPGTRAAGDPDPTIDSAGGGPEPEPPEPEPPAECSHSAPAEIRRESAETSRRPAEQSRDQQASAGSLPTIPDSPGRGGTVTVREGTERAGTARDGRPAEPPRKQEQQNQGDGSTYSRKQRGTRTRSRRRKGR